MFTLDVSSRERTRAFARVIGPYLAIFTTVCAVRLPELGGVITGLFAQPAVVWLLGAIMVGAGLVIVGVHRGWRGPLAVTVSLFGWFILLRGVLLVASPAVVRAGATATMLSPAGIMAARIAFAAMGVLGVVVALAGWLPEGVTTRASFRRPSQGC